MPARRLALDPIDHMTEQPAEGRASALIGMALFVDLAFRRILMLEILSAASA